MRQFATVPHVRQQAKRGDKDEAEGFEAGFPQEMERGSSLPVVVNEVPFERTVRDEGSGIAGGRGKVCAPDVT